MTAQPAGADGAPAGSGKPRILYVDDDVALVRLVARDLVRNDFAVTSATNVCMALDLMESAQFDLVVLDHYMPERDGLEMLAEIRKRFADPPPVVYLTGSEDSQLAVAALKAGAADYVIKTVEGDFLELLRTAIRQAIDQVQLRRERENAHAAVTAANRRLAALVEQQAVLLREMNHRIANSLALVASLVRLQSAAVTDAAARAALADTQHRLAAVMQVHRRLYTSADVERTDLSEYLRGLLEELQRSLSSEARRHRIVLQTVPVVVSTDCVVPIGVIVTELVTNAVKYAYPPPATPGEVRIVLRHDDTEERLRLIVEDDGIGFAQGQTAIGTGLGRKVIEAMASSLGAEVEIDHGHRGARIEVGFADRLTH
jgi:two-component sensor histidine kinase